MKSLEFRVWGGHVQPLCPSPVAPPPVPDPPRAAAVGLRDQGFELRVCDFEVWGLNFGFWCLVVGVRDLGLRV